uniref:Ig-like domain-containing protein n=1 Tax=Cyprinus carpio TaxID=7962 RepID=A0A8C1TUA5_CYPCA
MCIEKNDVKFSTSLDSSGVFFLFISGVSMIPSVFQPNVSITASVGGSVILECHTTADLVVAWFWLKQIPGQKLNPIINSRDAAYYHCGVLLYEKLYFGGGTYLTPVKIIQHPVLDSHHVGDSVNLHCTIFGESCSGGQSVYWLRYKPRESHSGIIYTDGDRKDQCETISVTGSTVQSCVHKVPKSLASDEIYFCSVVTCGKLIVGNGTKLIADGKACFIYLLFPFGLLIRIFFFPSCSPENNGLYHHTALCCISDISDSEYNRGVVMEKSYTQR